jgi:hypothetical protein
MYREIRKVCPKLENRVKSHPKLTPLKLAFRK